MNFIKAIVAGLALIMLLLVLGARAQVEEKSEIITVKTASEINGVVIVAAQGDKVPIELQCNQGFLACSPLQPGEYVMVRLPKNRGMYICSNVTVYTKPANATALGDEVGRYCISEK